MLRSSERQCRAFSQMLRDSISLVQKIQSVVIGPEPSSAGRSVAAVQLSHFGHSYTVHHFL